MTESKKNPQEKPEDSNAKAREFEDELTSMGLTMFVSGGLRRTDMFEYLDEFASEYSPELAENLVSVDYLENYRITAPETGERGVTVVQVKGEEWTEFLRHKPGWIQYTGPGAWPGLDPEKGKTNG
jgi:hypothetical protein